MAGTYKNFLKLLESWPLDKSKATSDLGQHIRDQIKISFSKGEHGTISNQERCNEYYESLLRLACNYHGSKYVRKLNSNASGLTKEECNTALSPEMQDHFKELEKGIIYTAIKKSWRYVKASNSSVTSSPSHNLGTINNTATTQDGTQNNVPHMPVMAKEVLKYFKLCSGKTFVDMTFGSGGHSVKILEAIPDAIIFALDRDPVAYEYAKQLAEKYPGRVIPLLGRFSELPNLLAEHNVLPKSIDGFLFDFGCSSMQFDTGQRGFSIAKDGPLDMRMDGFRCPDQPTAADVLEHIEEKYLVNILKTYGQEKRAKRVARAIIETRYTFRDLKTTSELAQVVESALSNEIRKDSIGRTAHSATKTFQALRIFVNNELNEINYGMLLAGLFLKQNGLAVAISFHSLEDTIVKRHLQGFLVDDDEQAVPLKYTSYNKSYTEKEMELIKKTPWKMLHKHVLTPADDEVSINPRSRSAKLRALVRIE